MIPALDPDPESDFQLVGDPYPDLNPVKSRIVIPTEAFGFWSLNQEFSLLAILDPDSDPVKSGIVTPLVKCVSKVLGQMWALLALRECPRTFETHFIYFH